MTFTDHELNLLILSVSKLRAEAVDRGGQDPNPSYQSRVASCTRLLGRLKSEIMDRDFNREAL